MYHNGSLYMSLSCTTLASYFHESFLSMQSNNKGNNNNKGILFQNHCT